MEPGDKNELSIKLKMHILSHFAEHFCAACLKNFQREREREKERERERERERIESVQSWSMTCTCQIFFTQAASLNKRKSLKFEELV